MSRNAVRFRPLGCYCFASGNLVANGCYFAAL